MTGGPAWPVIPSPASAAAGFAALDVHAAVVHHGHLLPSGPVAAEQLDAAASAVRAFIHVAMSDPV